MYYHPPTNQPTDRLTNRNNDKKQKQQQKPPRATNEFVAFIHIVGLNAETTYSDIQRNIYIYAPSSQDIRIYIVHLESTLHRCEKGVIKNTKAIKQQQKN